MSSFTPPPGYPRIKVVHSFHELVSTPFGDGVNALCWERHLAPEGFREVVEHLVAAGHNPGEGEEEEEGAQENEGLHTLHDARLASLPVSPAGRAAIEILLEDQRLLRAHGLAPVLDCIHGYPRDDEDAAEPVPTDVYSFHADSAPVPTDTWLCTYYGPSSEGLRNDEALRRIEIPATRAALLARYGGEDNADFREHLAENCYDLHYAPAPHAQPFIFGLGNLWRLAVDYPGSPVPPCIHRAPDTIPGQPPRLLLIS